MLVNNAAIGKQKNSQYLQPVNTTTSNLIYPAQLIQPNQVNKFLDLMKENQETAILKLNNKVLKA